MRLSAVLSLSALMVFLCGCPDDPDPTPDSGTPDAGAPDSGTPDAGVPDAGEPDAGAPDAGEPDAGTPDAGNELSEVPLWRVDHDATFAAGCFGRTLALGDLDGDGQKDLVVGAPPCMGQTREPGRVYLFPGQAPYFAKQGPSWTMDWRNSNSRTTGNGMTVSVGNIDGDAYADLLISGVYGALVFKGRPVLSELLSEVAFQVPGGGLYGNTLLTDVTGDGLDDLVSSKGGIVSVYRAQAGQVPFVLVPRTASLFGTSLRRVGDTNGDGVQDVVAYSAGTFRLYLGCKQDSALTCDGALTAEPVWSLQAWAMGLFPDLNGDGLPERFTGLGGGTWQLYLSDAQSPGGHGPMPTWQLVEDPLFSLLGSPVPVGDLDGDGQAHDFIASSMGRLYFFSPGAAISSDLKPSFAWPRADALPSHFEGFMSHAVLAPGDLDGNGFRDLVVGIAPPTGLVDGPAGRVVIFGGGHVPAPPAPRPHLPESKSCGLVVDPVNGKPDLAVDGDVLARSLYVERKTFKADACEVLEGCVPAAGQRRLLRFSTSILNLGNAVADVPTSEERPDLYVFDECHGHEHLTDFAGYALRDAQGNDVVTGRKQGFYLVDYHRQCSDAAPITIGERMSISAGWSDIYVADIPCQWIDITDLADGAYTLRVGVDEKDIIQEANAIPNEVKLDVRIDGDTVTVVR